MATKTNKMATKTTLQSIFTKYSNIAHNVDNYYIGGGLADDNRAITGECCYCGADSGHYVGCPRPKNTRFASIRHEDAKYDEGKLTLGEATQLFKKATGLATDEVKAIIEFSLPNMEWHHAGKLPKSYGGGMKKTYFLNSKEICKIASEWEKITKSFEDNKQSKRKAAEDKANLEQKRNAFLSKNATKIERVAEKPLYFYCLYSECHGKYGWFDASKNKYGMPEYHSGWAFGSEEVYNEFLNIK